MDDMEFADYVRRSVRIEDVVGRYTRLAPDAEGRLAGLCPFCAASEIYIARQLYACDRCACRGDAVNFIMRIEDVPLDVAVNKLWSKSGLPK
jgi:DNA primase